MNFIIRELFALCDRDELKLTNREIVMGGLPNTASNVINESEARLWDE